MPSFTATILEYIEPKKIYIWIGIFIILLIAVAVYSYQVYVPSLSKDIINADIANANTRNERANADVFFFSADWCPHCASAKPLWNNFKENYDGKIINGRMINCVSVDCTDETNLESQRLMTQYDVVGFPTIKMQKGDEVISFDAKITQYSLKEFVNNML